MPFIEKTVPHDESTMVGRHRTFTILDNITEWRRGCTCGGPLALAGRKDHPGDCVECTEALVESIEKHLQKSWLRRLIARWL